MVSASMELDLSNIFLRSMIFIDLTIDKPRKQKSYFEFHLYFGQISLNHFKHILNFVALGRKNIVKQGLWYLRAYPLMKSISLK